MGYILVPIDKDQPLATSALKNVANATGGGTVPVTNLEELV